MEDVIVWITGTPANIFIRANYAWLIPLLQVIHIAAVGVVVSSTLLMTLRLLGIIGGGEAKDAFTRRYLPWVWRALTVLFLSGSVLIYGEPERDLTNTVFWSKMSLIIVAVILTLIMERPILRDPEYWEKRGRHTTSRILAGLAICCWVAIVFCGRWIAYTWGG